MYTTLGNTQQRLGSAVINPFDGQIGLWRYGFSEAEAEAEEKRLVTPANPRSIYSGYGAFDGTGTTLIGGAAGALMTIGTLAAVWKYRGSQGTLTDKLKKNWYCVVGGAAMIIAWETLSGKFRA